MTKVLETKKLVEQFGGIHAVDEASLSIEEGAITGLIGPNGSGKTTLVNLVSGIIPFDSGTVVIDEATTLTAIKPYQIPFYGITRTFQNVRLFEQLSVLDNIIVILTERTVMRALFERHKEYHYEKARAVLEHVGLFEKRSELARTLSYGQRKLLEIARALAMDAKLFLLDEPFAGLSPEMVAHVSAILKELRDEGKTIVLIEHNVGLIRELADYLIVMDTGRVLATGRPEEVLAQRDVIEAYLGD